MIVLALLLIYVAAVYLAPANPDRPTPRALGWTPHALVRAGSGTGIGFLQLWILVLLGAFGSQWFLDEFKAETLQTCLVVVLASLSIHCLWMARPLKSSAKSIEGYHFGVKPKGEAAILLGPEVQLLELASISALLRHDLHEIGIEQVRLCRTRHLPATLPNGIVMQEIVPELLDALIDVHEQLVQTGREQAGKILSLAERVDKSAADLFEVQSSSSALEDKNRRLEAAIAIARNSNASPFGRNFSSVETEVKALFDRLRAIAEDREAVALETLETQMLKTVAAK